MSVQHNVGADNLSRYSTDRRILVAFPSRDGGESVTSQSVDVLRERTLFFKEGHDGERFLGLLQRGHLEDNGLMHERCGLTEEHGDGIAIRCL
jgi:hypothetical protein